MSTADVLTPAPQQTIDRPAGATPSRLLSLDVFRGLCVAGMILVDNPGSHQAAYWPLRHAEWNGWTPADLIFPSFLFLVGVSLVFSFCSRLRRGETRKQIFFHAFKRSLVLIALGLLINISPGIGVDLHGWRIEGVLQRIALCYLMAAALVLWTSRRAQLAAIAAGLLGYWAILRFVPVPGLGAPGHDFPFMDPDRNLVAWLDRALFDGRLYNGARDPEGLISTIPALASTLLGVMTGYWLRTEKTPRAKAVVMLVFGVVSFVAGLAWNQWFPINKNLWTSSFVLLTAGFALMFLALLYWILEIKQWRRLWTVPVLVFGMNAIAGFVADALVWGPADAFKVTGQSGAAVSWHEAANEHLSSWGLSQPNASLLYSMAAVLLCWTLLWLLWRKRIFLKI
jgi:predicted acyltransferase